MRSQPLILRGMSDKTYAELVQATDLQDGDLLASFRGSSGPLKSFTFSLLVSTIQSRLASLFLSKAQNLNDLPDKAQSRLSLGLGNSATLNVGQNTGQVAAGDDSRFAAAMPKAGGDFTGAVTRSGLTLARVASGTTTNAGRISWGTAAPGTLEVGEIYLQVSS